MNFDGGTVRYNIEVNTQDFERSLDALDKEFDRLDKKYNSLFAAGLLDEKEIKKIEELKSNLESYGKVLEESEEGTEEYEYALKSANQAMDEFASALGEVKDAAEETDAPMQSLSETIGNLAGKAGLSALKGLATGVTTALVGLAKKGISATNFLETSQTAMSGLLGSMEEGQKAMGAAASFWSNNPFNRFDVTNATKQLVQYGRTVEQLPKDLKILGNVSLSTGVAIDELALRYGRIASSGRAMTQDIEIMSNRGIPIYRELAKQLGTTTEGVREFASQGKIDFETFKKAMEGAVDPEAMEKYEQTLDRAKDKLSGSVTTLAGALAGYKIVNDEVVINTEGLYKSWIKLLRAIAGSGDEGTGLRNPKLLEGLTKIGEALGNLIDKLSDKIEPFLNLVAKVVNFIGDHTETLIPIAALALNVVTKLGSQIPVLGTVFQSLGGGITKVSSLMGGFIKENKLLSIVLGVVIASVVDLIKNDESFRQDLQSLFNSLMAIAKTLIPVVQNIASAFASLAQSAVVQGGIKLIVSLIARLAELLSSMPTEVLLSIVSAILAVKLSSVNPWLVWIAAIGLVVDILKDLAPQFMEAAHNAIIGFVNGIVDGGRKVVEAVKNVVNAAVTTVKNMLGIHSPSTVMYGVGTDTGLGLANGITDSSSVVQKAMNNLAKDVLKQAQKVIGNMSDFGLIDYNGAYKQWKKVADLFTVGSEQYESAIEKMEDARKNVNLEIIKLQKEYNETLDNSISKIQKFYDVFDEVSTKGGKNATQIIKNLDKQVAQTAEWAEAQKIINQSGLDPKFIEELKNMGVESVSELSSIANMTSSELEQLNELWLKKQSIAEESAVDQLQGYKNEVLDQISDLADGIDGETVKVKEESGRLVSSIGEGIVGSLPTIDSAMSQLGAYIQDAARNISSGGGGNYNVDTNVPPAGTDEDTIGKLLGLDDITGAAKKWASEKLPILIGVLAGGLFGKKLLSGIVSKVSDAGGLGKILSSLFSGGKATSVAKSGISNLTNLTKSIGGIKSVGTELKGFDKIASYIKKGGLLILLIAADIWAISKAISEMDKNLRDVEWENFGSELGMMAAAIAAMAVLDGILGIKVIAQAVAIGGAIMLEIAVDIVAIAHAIREMDENIPEDVDRIKPKLKLMVETIGAFEVLGAIAGLLAPLEFFGAAAIIAICKEIEKTADVLKHVNDTIPDDYSALPGKIDLIKKTIEKISDANIGQVISSIITSFSVEPVKKIAGMYSEVAGHLEEIGKVQFNGEKINSNLDIIKSAIDKVSAKTDIITTALNALATKFEADYTENAARALKAYGEAVDTIERIGNLKVSDGWEKNVEKIREVMNKIIAEIGNTYYVNYLNEAQQGFDAVNQIIKDFTEIIPNVNSMGEFKVEVDKINAVADDVFAVSAHMSKQAQLSNMAKRLGNISDAVGATESIVKKFTEIVPTVNDLAEKKINSSLIGDKSHGILDDIKTVLKNIRSAAEQVSNVGQKEMAVGRTESILWKFTEIVDVVNDLASKTVSENAKSQIETVRNLVWEISQVNTSGYDSLETKEKTVDGAKTLAEKFASFAEAMRNINTDGMADPTILTNSAYTLVEGVKSGVAEKLPDIESLGKELVVYLNNGISNSLSMIQEAGANAQSNFWWGVQNKMNDEYQQGRAMGLQLRQGMYDVDYGNAGWWAVQGFINGANNRAYAGDGVYHTGWWIANNFLQGLKDRGGQGSPWKTTIESGIFAGQGLVEGLKQMESEVIDEAEVLADGIVEALDISDTTVSPELNLRGSLAPMVNEDYGYSNSGRGVVVNMENNVYTELDMAQVERDLSYSLSRI